jgi:hypothetical protein
MDGLLPIPPIPAPGMQLPSYWALLDETDKLAYTTMRQGLSSSACKHRRHHATEINKDILATIHGFVMRNDNENWKRALVCGICWLPDAIAINTRQLRLLLSKCKSSINSMFQSLGFTAVPTTTDYGSALAAAFPLIKDNFAELRQWTIRSVKPPVAEDENGQPPEVLIELTDATPRVEPGGC